MGGGFAWVTLATNDSYSLGALVLAHSLKQVGTQQQLAVLITPGVTNAMRAKLGEIFNVVKEVNILDSKDEANLKLLKRPELGITFTKLHCWRLTQFEKCVFLDADTLVLENCDELFEREEFSAAPDIGWPDCFNSGVFVYRPSNDTYEKLIQFALEKGSFDGGDQGLLNLYFSDWAHKDISKHLPFIYNMSSTACYSYLPAFKQFGKNAKIIHFIGSSKPWLQYFNTETRKVHPSEGLGHLEEILQLWWNIFCSLIHPTLSPDMAGLAGAFANLTLGQARTPEQQALDDHLRRQGWEVGNIDYLGRDSFDNIWSKICQTLSEGSEAGTEKEASPPKTEKKPAESVTPATEATPEKVQTQLAATLPEPEVPKEETAKTTATPIAIPESQTPADLPPTSKLEGATEAPIIESSKPVTPLVPPETLKSEVSTTAQALKIETSAPVPQPTEAASGATETSKPTELVTAPTIPQAEETKSIATKSPEEASKTHVVIPEETKKVPTEVSAADVKASEVPEIPPTDAPKVIPQISPAETPKEDPTIPLVEASTAPSSDAPKEVSETSAVEASKAQSASVPREVAEAPSVEAAKADVDVPKEIIQTPPVESAKTSVDLPKEVPPTQFTEMLQEVSQTSVETPKEVPQAQTVEDPIKVLQSPPVKVPQTTPVEEPKKVPQTPVVESPKGISETTSDCSKTAPVKSSETRPETPSDASKTAPVKSSEKTPVEGLKGAAKDTSEEIQKKPQEAVQLSVASITEPTPPTSPTTPPKEPTSPSTPSAPQPKALEIDTHVPDTPPPAAQEAATGPTPPPRKGSGAPKKSGGKKK